jgi:glyoxylase-like metal-dependent hydrolase (beta-lactamase superfamily II)
MKTMMLVALGATAMIGVSPATARAAGTPAAERLYAIDCGTLSAPDKSLWTPGKHVGEPARLSENCYLIKHKSGYLLWDTGISDKLIGKPLTTHGMTLARDVSLIDQLAKIGVKPSDIRFVAVSHTHPDHTGNLAAFPDATLLIQQKELDWTAKAGFLKLPPDRKVQPLSGDFDVFGDGSVVILSTPGHTPGHQSLMVHLNKTGWLILGGDVSHLEENYVADVVPPMNIEQEQSHQSMQRVRDIVAQRKATLWINHDPDQTAKVRHSPEFYK